MNQLAILTTFMDLPRSYGLVPVVLNQLRCLVDHDVKPALFVQEGFERHADAALIPEGVEIKPYVPFLHLFHYFPNTKKQTHDVPAKGKHRSCCPFAPTTNFDRQVKSIEDMLEPELCKYQTVITHDIVFQIAFLVHNQAIRNIAARHPEMRWIHWCHSGPDQKPQKLEYPHTLRFTGMTNSVWICPNQSMRQQFAFMYDVPIKRVRTVYHIFDVQDFFDMHPFSRQLINKHSLLDCDVLCVWPTRIDDVAGKGIDKAVWLIGAMNKLCDAKLVFLNSWSNSPKARETIQNLRKVASEWGLPEENLVFSSAEGAAWELGVPRKVVQDLMQIANLYVMPSQSETFSYAMLEAAMCKNLLVLNDNLDVMHELAADNAYYLPSEAEWGGQKWTINYNPHPQAVYMDHAQKILELIRGNKILLQHRRALSHYTSEWVWKNQLEPLLND